MSRADNPPALAVAPSPARPGRPVRDYAAHAVPVAPSGPLGPLIPRVAVSIVIVNWNTRELLRACLSSIPHAMRDGDEAGAVSHQIEVIVVDNGSHDGSAEMVARAFPHVRLLINERNVGFAAANNLALRDAHGRYLLLLNSDTVVRPGAVEAMAAYMDAHPELGAVGPRLLNADGSVQLSAHDFPRLDHDAVMLLDVKHWPLIGAVARRFAQRAYGPRHEQTRTVDWVSGACLVLRREALRQVGVLDEAYFFFFEESDLCYRLSERGWRTAFLANAEVIHMGGQSRDRAPAASLVWYYRGLLRYYRLHSSRRRYTLVRAGVLIGAFGHIMWRLPGRRRHLAQRSFLAAYARILSSAMEG